jgi:hypothetical protein
MKKTYFLQVNLLQQKKYKMKGTVMVVHDKTTKKERTKESFIQ